MGRTILDGPDLRVTPPQVSAFVDLVARIDRAAQERLGGVAVIYQPAIGAPVSITGMFDDPYVSAQGDAHAGVEAVGPSVSLRLEDLPVDPEQDEPTLIIGGIVYRIVERQPDGVGGVVLKLRLVT